MTEAKKTATREQPHAETETVTSKETVRGSVISSSIISALLFSGTAFIVVVGCGVLNILAAAGGWNPLHWKGALWTGIFMVALPSAVSILAVLPHAARQKIPESALGITFILFWIAFFWAACGGH